MAPKPETGLAGQTSRWSQSVSRMVRLPGPRLASWLLLAVLLAVWQAAGSSPTRVALTSSPTLVAGRLAEMASDGSLVANLLPTIEETIGGLLVGLAVGIVGGAAMAVSDHVDAALGPYVMAINGVPKVALGPFFIVWFGIGLTSKVLLAASVVFVVVIYNTREGVESIDRDLVDVLRSMKASRYQMVRQVVIPSLTPWILTSIKIGIGLALTGAVVGELVGATAGLGWYITYSLNTADMTGAITALIVMAVMAIILYFLVLGIERSVLSWRGPGVGRA